MVASKQGGPGNPYSAERLKDLVNPRIRCIRYKLPSSRVSRDRRGFVSRRFGVQISEAAPEPRYVCDEARGRPTRRAPSRPPTPNATLLASHYALTSMRADRSPDFFPCRAACADPLTLFAKDPAKSNQPCSPSARSCSRRSRRARRTWVATTRMTRRATSATTPSRRTSC